MIVLPKFDGRGAAFSKLKFICFASRHHCSQSGLNSSVLTVKSASNHRSDATWKMKWCIDCKRVLIISNLNITGKCNLVSNKNQIIATKTQNTGLEMYINDVNMICKACIFFKDFRYLVFLGILSIPWHCKTSFGWNRLRASRVSSRAQHNIDWGGRRACYSSVQALELAPLYRTSVKNGLNDKWKAHQT
jgi:hypothetical protein